MKIDCEVYNNHYVTVGILEKLVKGLGFSEPSKLIRLSDNEYRTYIVDRETRGIICVTSVISGASSVIWMHTADGTSPGMVLCPIKGVKTKKYQLLETELETSRGLARREQSVRDALMKLWSTSTVTSSENKDKIVEAAEVRKELEFCPKRGTVEVRVWDYSKMKRSEYRRKKLQEGISPAIDYSKMRKTDEVAENIEESLGDAGKVSNDE